MTNDMPSKVEQLKVLLSTQGEPKERLQTLNAYLEFLATPELQAFLCEYQPTDASIEVRSLILALLVGSRSTFLTTYAPFRQMLLTTISSEAEPKLRRLAAQTISERAGVDTEFQKLTVELLINEFDETLRTACVDALSQLPQVHPETSKTLSEFLNVAPLFLQLPVFEIVTKSGDGAINETASLGLLRPSVPTPTRTVALETLKKLPRLTADGANKLSAAIAGEVSPVLMQQMIEKLFAMSELDSATASSALTALLSHGKESQAALTLLSFKLSQQPQLLAGLITAMASHPDAGVKIQILQMLKNSNLLPLWQIALKDPNPIVREWALMNSSHILARQPENMLPLILQAFATEQVPLLRTLMLEQIERQPHLINNVDFALIGHLFTERDPQLLKRITQMTLQIPVDRSRNDQRPMILGWINSLQDVFLDRATRLQIIEKLEQLDYAADPAMEAALKIQLSQVRDLRELDDLFPRLQKLIKDPAYLLPQLLVLFEKFIGHWGASPLPEILNMVRDLKSQVPEIQARIPYLAKLSGQTWLLEGVSETEQKNELFPTIQRHINNAEFSKAASLMREGFQNSTLRKSEVTKLYAQSLAHPDMYEISQEVVSMMKTVNLITPEILQVSFDYLTHFVRRNDTNYRVLDFVMALGPQVEGFDERFLNFMSSERFRRFAQQNDEPRNDSESQLGPLSWDDTRMWRLAYPGWQDFDQLSDELKRKWARRHATDNVDPEFPVQWSSALFALWKYNGLGKIEADDLMAIGQAFQQTNDRPELALLRDRAACLFAKQWNRFEMTDENRKKLPAPLIEMATEIYLAEIENWIALGGLEYSGRVEPMNGIDLDVLQKKWKLGHDAWETFWKGYTELIGVNGTDIIPPEPNTKRRATPHFHMYSKNAGVGVLLDFLLETPAPMTANVEYHTMWKKILWTASKRIPDLYTKALQRSDAGTKARIAALMTAPAGPA